MPAVSRMCEAASGGAVAGGSAGMAGCPPPRPRARVLLRAIPPSDLLSPERWPSWHAVSSARACSAILARAAYRGVESHMQLYAAARAQASTPPTGLRMAGVDAVPHALQSSGPTGTSSERRKSRPLREFYFCKE
eukprot:scaffold12184_cov114-Isochrysis_galbana.AAC.6